MLHIQMLGDFSIKVDGNPLTTLNKPRQGDRLVCKFTRKV
jgi:hypothetical protein